MCNFIDDRFESENIGNSVTFISGGGADLSDSVDEVDTGQPLVDCEFVLSCEVMDVLDERAHQLSRSSVGLGTDRLDDIGGESWVESLESLGSTGGFLLGRHVVAVD